MVTLGFALSQPPTFRFFMAQRLALSISVDSRRQLPPRLRRQKQMKKISVAIPIGRNLWSAKFFVYLWNSDEKLEELRHFLHNILTL